MFTTPAERLVRLARLKNFSTRYELAATHPDGRKVLIAYTPRRNRSGLFDAVRSRGTDVVRLCGSDNFTLAKRSADGATCGEWTINFTGRTQRDCILGEELPYVAD